ncbi:MAG: amino acid ABC transporter substrate-binding protein [Alphaproteobacteria bacterium]|nr:amino acid ABC transporter substrate-binding protein [Alphaproteobacteria bacterium]
MARPSLRDGFATVFGALAVVAITLSAPSVQAADRLATIQSGGVLRVCIWPDYFAISYRNPRTSELEGIDIDMALAFAKDLGVKVEFVDSSFAKLVENMENDACDIAMHGVGVRPDRQEHMDFSIPHLSSGIYGISDKANADIQTWADIDKAGHVVVVQKGTYMEPVMLGYLKHARLSVVDSFKGREQEVQAGRADVFMTDYPYGRRMAVLSDWGRLLEPETTLAPTPYAYAVPKGDPAWLARVNAFITAAKTDGRLREYAERNGLLPIAVLD